MVCGSYLDFFQRAVSENALFKAYFRTVITTIFGLAVPISALIL